MSNLERPVFVDFDPDAITSQLVEIYEQIVGKTLYPAQPERLFIDVIAYRECLIRQAIQEAAEQNLIEYARDAALDHLAQNIGAVRLTAKPAECNVRITLSEPASADIVIAKGLQLKTADGLFEFKTSEDCTVFSGGIQAECSAVCSSAGTDANGYLPGSISLSSSTEGIAAAYNITASSNGTDEEDDDSFRERIPLALEAYSCAGPALAYKYWALSAHSSITDVSVTSPSAGVVNIYPLTSSGVPSDQILALIAETVSGEKHRPLTDKVNILVPKAIHFTVSANLTLYGSTDRSAVLAKINKLLSDYQSSISLKMGRDVVPSQLAALMHIDGVYSVDILSPNLIAVDNQSYAVLDSWNLNIGSIVYE